MSQCVHRRVNLGSFPLLGSVEARASAARGRGLEGAAVEDGRAGHGVFTCRQPQHRAQVMRHVFETIRPQPALGLLLHGLPWRQIVGHHPPRTARTDEPAQPVVEFAQGMFALRSVLLHQGQVGSAKAPLFVAYIAGITASSFRDPKLVPTSLCPCAAFSRPKFMTGSRSSGAAPPARGDQATDGQAMLRRSDRVLSENSNEERPCGFSVIIAE